MSPSPPSDPPPPPPPPVLPLEQSGSSRGSGGGGGGVRYPNQREAGIPDPATLREQWRFAIRQYSRWYSQAWGTAILAGASFFALGWLVKGSNPLPSRAPAPAADRSEDSSAAAATTNDQ